MQLIQTKNVWPICTLPIIWIFTEGDEIKSRLPFKIFFTLHWIKRNSLDDESVEYLFSSSYVY